ncbi:hypothetical protein [Psychromonas sp. MB-3u-54]|uniref:hypothetical protein n=1 Tax=Psychromonas sp. MB-3u-54 TaxID=2058319 RepID=UPI0012FF159B|nr:hypothetical protein [Psychromonas sp. MB-3u-54]
MKLLLYYRQGAFYAPQPSAIGAEAHPTGYHITRLNEKIPADLSQQGFIWI